MSKSAPTGIGHWSECWDIVGAADAEFIVALVKWETTGSAADKQTLRAAYHSVRHAWSSAVVEWAATQTADHESEGAA